MSKATLTHNTITTSTAIPSTSTPATTSPTVDDGIVQYARYLPAAMKLAATEIKPLHADVHVAIANAARGVESVLAHEGELTAALPLVDVAAMRSLADVGDALAYAMNQVARYTPTPSNIKVHLAQARKLRALLLASADALVLSGVFSAPAIAKIRKGHGPIDAAEDCLALAALFTKHAAETAGKVAVTAADIQNSTEVGTRLVRMLRPGAVRKPADKALVAATEARDRLWTLFEKSWRLNVWRAGAWLFDKEVDSNVPPLQSRIAGRRAAKGTVAPATGTPVVAPTAPTAAAGAPAAAAVAATPHG